MAGTLTVSGLAAGLATGEKVIGPVTDTGTAVVGQITDLTLASGDNTLAVPSGATHVLIVLPANNAVTIKVRSNLNSSDGGMPIGLTGWVKVPLPSGTTSVILNAASSAGAVEATFI
jgi:hypothetical protein